MHYSNCNPSEFTKILFTSTLSILILFFGFFSNYWQVADQKWFVNHQQDSESLILGRMVKSRQDGVFSDAGLTGFGSIDVTSPESFTGLNRMTVSIQYEAYLDGLTFGSYSTYNSQIGGQGILFSTLDQLIPFSPQKKLCMFHALTSLLSAIALTAIILWFYLEFGLSISLFVLASAILSQWLVVFGRNLWWSMWAFYLPMVVVMHYLKHRFKFINSQSIRFGILIFIAVFIKCLFNGYEYITTTLVMMFVPFVYYSVLNRLHFRKFLTGLYTATFSSFLAIFVASFILFLQIGSVKGSFFDGINHVVSSFERRTHGNYNDFPTVYADSLKSSTPRVIAKYLRGTFFDANNYLFFSNSFIREYLLKVRYLYLILLFILMSGTLYFFKNKWIIEEEKRKNIALICATWISIFAPLSWFVIFKAHSYIHSNMNYILWQMPFVFFGFAICGLVMKSLLSNLIHTIRRST